MMPDFSALFVTAEGKPLKVGDQTITVVSRALRWTPPWGFGGIVWNRPVAVKVLTSSGVEHTLAIVDETRRRQIMIGIFGLVGAILIALLFSKKPA
jgi:hypothetical protein